jgi:hypothetical protein
VPSGPGSIRNPPEITPGPVVSVMMPTGRRAGVASSARPDHIASVVTAFARVNPGQLCTGEETRSVCGAAPPPWRNAYDDRATDNEVQARSQISRDRSVHVAVPQGSDSGAAEAARLPYPAGTLAPLSWAVDAVRTGTGVRA